MSVTDSDPAGATVQLLRADSAFRGKQGLDYFAGVSAETTGARGICMHLLRLPPGARAEAHLHEAHETAIYTISGTAEMWYGDGLERHMVVPADHFLFVSIR